MTECVCVCVNVLARAGLAGASNATLTPCVVAVVKLGGGVVCVEAPKTKRFMLILPKVL